ncbi:cation:proton antiporter regulatory subunit [Halalkalibacterium halodurans]|jgi:TrkA domain protein|uniref:cation:proton antiporter regulatory subunit n=1 Tax=Halalkalibacterium halodurans TaxID=86665 RepID=UPI002AA9C531|nr:cation:proton antiporter regulatory subunit [Halalkalibacterium halodurans]MDY7223514.1 cation:proton antiporter regulatory subunit [Halalkalibacterium halodurans]MDY7242735.1 cation:proton antiporter regulatory subunit [Halalkalibacterium halodurans]MED4123118.1 cation:proton antiporter regulatory subunit [Halalkalibacterium halodurans]
MEVKMADLPGIGKKMTFMTAQRNMIVLIIHHTGKRELYFFAHEDNDEPDFSINLTADETRELGAQLLGAVFQPVDNDKMKMIKNKMVMEWIELKKNSPIVNKTIGEANIRKKTGVSVIGIVREGEVQASPEVDEVLYQGDVLIAVGKQEQIDRFERLCEGEA